MQNQVCKTSNSFWGKKELKIDFFISIGLSILLSSLYQFGYVPNFFLYVGNLITASLTLVGFQITSLTILISFPENKKLKILSELPTYTHIFYYFIFNIFIFILSFIIGLIGLIFAIQNTIFGILFFTVFIYGIIGLIRAIWMIKRLIAIIHPIRPSK